MTSFYRIAEIALFSAIDFLPYLILALYPFRNRLRYPPVVLVFLTIIATALQIAFGVSAVFLSGENKGFISIASTMVYFLFYFWAVRSHIGKILFTLLMISNIANFIVSSAKCIEGILFPAFALQRYRWSNSLIMAVVQALVLIPFFFYIRRFYKKALEREEFQPIWRYLWLIPATFYLLWYYHFYGNEKAGLEIALQPENMLFLLFINLGALLVYYIVVNLIDESDKNVRLQMENRLLALENLQYRNLKQKINDTRRARHDLRHHFAVMAGYLSDGKTECLKAYLSAYLKTIPEDNSLVYCQNYAINLLLLYFAQQAKEADIEFSVHMGLTEQLGIAESDFSVVMGNLLENAIDACTEQNKGKRKIIVRGKCEEEAILLTVDNTFTGKLKCGKDGDYLSTKHKGKGLGLESVRCIAARYHGVFTCEEKDGMFYTSVLLNVLDDRKTE